MKLRASLIVEYEVDPSGHWFTELMQSQRKMLEDHPYRILQLAELEGYRFQVEVADAK